MYTVNTIVYLQCILYPAFSLSIHGKYC